MTFSVQFERVPLTIQLSIDDLDIIEWLQGLERGGKGREVKAAIRAWMAVNVTIDAHLANMGSQIDELKLTAGRFEAYLDKLRAIKVESKVDELPDSTELAPDLIKNVVGNFKPGRKVNKENGE